MKENSKQDVSPAGLLFIPDFISWEKLDGDLVSINYWMSQQGQLARATAKKARQQGNMLKCRKFQSIARAYEAASSKLFDIGFPF